MEYEKLEGKITKILDSRMDEFIELGMSDGGSIYAKKPIERLKFFKAVMSGVFTYHRSYWGANKREVRILDNFIPSDEPKQKTTQQINGKTIQEIHHEDFIEFQRKTETTTGKTENREVLISSDSVRVHGDMTDEEQIKKKIDLFIKHKEYFESKIKKKGEKQ